MSTNLGVPALIYLNMMKNSLETITYNNILPLMDNLVNNTNSILDITGAWQATRDLWISHDSIYDFFPSNVSIMCDYTIST